VNSVYLVLRLKDGTPLHNVGIRDDGTLINPNGYPETLVREAIEAADARHDAFGRPSRRGAAALGPIGERRNKGL